MADGINGLNLDNLKNLNKKKDGKVNFQGISYNKKDLGKPKELSGDEQNNNEQNNNEQNNNEQNNNEQNNNEQNNNEQNNNEQNNNEQNNNKQNNNKQNNNEQNNNEQNNNEQNNNEQKNNKQKNNKQKNNKQNNNDINLDKLNFDISQEKDKKENLFTENKDINQKKEIENNKNKSNKSNPEEISKSLILNANKEELENQKKDEIDIGKIEIPDKIKKKKKNLKFGDSGVELEVSGKRMEISYWKIIQISTILSIIGVFLILVGFAYLKYINYSLQTKLQNPYSSFVEKIDDWERKLDGLLKFSEYDFYYNKGFLGGELGKVNLSEILKTDTITYIQKKKIIQNNLEKLFSNLIQNHQEINKIKGDITKYGFISKEIYDLIQNKKNILSIKKSLMSLEIIKFSSAIRVFSYFETFINGFSNFSSYDKDKIKNNMEKIISRGESDIYTYINNCYLNPYEWGYDCNIIGDFDYYYNFIAKEQNFDRDLFKQLIYYIDMKLEQSEVPNFNIIFKQFNPIDKNISFDIFVNTFQKDELNLLEQNILNPHIFIVTELLNLLKQSKFIIGKGINARNLKVVPNTIRIGNTQVNVNSSNLSFTLSIQKNTQREIFDYVEIIENQTDIDENFDNKQSEILDSTDKKSNKNISGNKIQVEQNNSINLTGINKLNKKEDKESITGAVKRISLEFLEMQKDLPSIKFEIQNKGFDNYKKQMERELKDLIKYYSGYTINQIEGVFNYLSGNDEWRNKVNSIKSLYKQKEGEKTYFEKIQGLIEQKEFDNEIVKHSGQALSNEIKPQEEKKSDFWNVRKFFESNN